MKTTSLSYILQVGKGSILCLLLAIGVAGCGSKKKIPRTIADKNAVGITGDQDGNYADGKKGPNSPGETPDGEYDRDKSGDLDRNPEPYGGEKGPEGTPIPELANVYFSLDSDELDQAAESVLKRNATYLKNQDELQVVLRGHTDDQGTEEYNFSLGSNRAQSVRDYLIDAGIDGSRLETVSFGETLRIEEGDDESARAQNRRVEFFVYTIEN